MRKDFIIGGPIRRLDDTGAVWAQRKMVLVSGVVVLALSAVRRRGNCTGNAHDSDCSVVDSLFGGMKRGYNAVARGRSRLSF
jgi:hypothetical protein